MKKKVIYFDCFAGISGDMTIGALLDIGADREYLINQLKLLNLDGYNIEIKSGIKKGITGTDFNVVLTEEVHHQHIHHFEHREEHEHHLYKDEDTVKYNSHHSHSQEEHMHKTHNHHHEVKRTEPHKHHEEKETEEHHHHGRNFKDIREIIDNSQLNNNTKEMSKRIFRIIAEAEAKIHGKAVDEVHFHEIGAVDSIVDIVGTAICIDYLKIDKIISSSVNVGGGFIKCQHGVIPVPAPATVEILKGIPVFSNGIKKEMTTPTGAGILKALATEFGDFPSMVIEKSGYGLGKRDVEIPNVLRVVTGFVEEEDIKKNS